MLPLTRRDATHTYDGEKRLHLTPLGNLPGVTTILSATSGKSFSQWRKNNPVEAQRTRDRGIEWDRAVRAYWEHFQLGSGHIWDLGYSVARTMRPVVWEHQVYSALGFSGSIDLLCEWDGLTLVDWKTSTKRKTPSQITDYFLQISAYAFALKELDNIKIDRASIIVLAESETAPQVFDLEWDSIGYFFSKFEDRLNEYYRMR